MAFTIKIYEKDKYMYALMKARLGTIYPEAYITNPYLETRSDTDGDMFGEFTKVLYNPRQFGEEFDPLPHDSTLQSLKECLDRPVPVLDQNGIVDCRKICNALGINSDQDQVSNTTDPGKGRIEVLIPFVYISDRENYIRNNYQDLTDEDISLRLDFTSRLRAPDK